MPADTPDTRKRTVGPFAILLFALITLLMVTPFLGQEGGALWTWTWTVLVLAGLVNAAAQQRFLIVAIGIAIPMLLLRWLDFESRGWEVAEPLATAVFLGLVVALVIRHLATAREVDTDTILGAVNAFLLLGVVFAELHLAIETFHPGSYLLADLPLQESLSEKTGGLASTLRYYSFTTLTTLGYGDIRPATLAARMCSTGEAIVGQLFVAILIAGLVGTNLGRGRRQDEAE